MKGQKGREEKNFLEKYGEFTITKIFARIYFANLRLSNILRGFNFANLSKIRENREHLSTQKLVLLRYSLLNLHYILGHSRSTLRKQPFEPLLLFLFESKF